MTKQPEETPINPLSIIEKFIYREISRWMYDEENEAKIQRLSHKLMELSRWDSSEKTEKLDPDRGYITTEQRIHILEWENYASTEVNDNLELVIGQKVATSLAAQITQELIWNLISEINRKMYSKRKEHGRKDLLELVNKSSIGLHTKNEDRKIVADDVDHSSLDAQLTQSILSLVSEKNQDNKSRLSSILSYFPSIGKSILMKISKFSSKDVQFRILYCLDFFLVLVNWPVLSLLV
jgi:hypothetical protein